MTAAAEASPRRRVFIDIGAHSGSTARGVFASPFAFDQVISVEPDPAYAARLREIFADKIAEGRYAVAEVGLYREDGTLTLYGDNAGGGASIVAGKVGAGERRGIEIPVISWRTFLERYDLAEAALFIKINCEGAEVDIVDSILDHDAGNIRSLLIDYDIIKAPFGGWKKWRSIRRLKAAGAPFLLAEHVFVKRGARGYLENWLGSLKELRDPPTPREPANRMQVARVKYLEIVSALGVKHDFLKDWRRRLAAK